MGAHLWQKQTWERLFAENMVIVCTAEVLVQCLMHSFISVARVNILIFDEAHHAKNNHPYARLMKEYYVNEPEPSGRPRIFGMTASPVDTNTNVREAARKLESLLHSRIVTVSKETLDRNNIYRPSEEVYIYPPLPAVFETPFHHALKARYCGLQGFQKFSTASKIISSELGRWASDKYWTFAFTEEETNKKQRRQELYFNQTEEDQSVDKLNTDIARLHEAAAFVQQQDFGLPTPNTEDVSVKVLGLKSWLDRYYERSSE